MHFSTTSIIVILYGLASILFGIFKIDILFWVWGRTFFLKSWMDKSDRKFVNILGGVVCLILGLLLTLRRK